MAKAAKGNPWIIRVTPEIHPPSLKDNTADADRLTRAIQKHLDDGERAVLDLDVLRTLTPLLRKYNYHDSAHLYHDGALWHLIDVRDRTKLPAFHGLAVDLGSSTVVIRLVDLSTNRIQEETSFTNPQTELGADILTRIHHASQPGGLQQLQQLLVGRLNQEIQRVAKEQGIETEAIVGLSAAGNTTMTHLFLGLDPYWICREPYIPVVNKPGIFTASDLGIAIHPRAPVLMAPNVGSYFGGDLMAGILASGMVYQEEVSFLVDVGTNAEVVIGNQDWLMGCAGAAGPALEGGVAGMGMMAGPGVIDSVTIDPGTREFRIRTIQNLPPIGICGSGLIDLAAHLFLTGMIDLRGKFVPGACGGRLIDRDGIYHLVVVTSEVSGTGEPLFLSQPDIDALIRSKAAMYTILTTVSSTVAIPLTHIQKFYVAGTFGAYIDPRSAITIGMIPDLPLETYVPLGNSSLEGAARALLSAQERDEMFRIRDRITYLELNVNQEFMNLFSAAKFIPHTDRSLFPSVKVR